MDSKLYTPLGFSKVYNNIYRSAYPSKKTYPFLKLKKFKILLCLTPNDIKNDNNYLLDYCRKNDIQLLDYDLRHNQDPFQVMDDNIMYIILEFLLNNIYHDNTNDGDSNDYISGDSDSSSSYVGSSSSSSSISKSNTDQLILICCTNGKVRTGCVIACLRKIVGWSMTSIISGDYDDDDDYSDSDMPMIVMMILITMMMMIAMMIVIILMMNMIMMVIILILMISIDTI